MKKPVVLLQWGSAGPNGGGQYTFTLYPDGSLEIDENDWCGGTTHIISRRHAIQLAKAILTAAGKPT